MMKKKITRALDNEFQCIDQENGNTNTLTSDEVRTGSITPTTFKSREFEEDTSDQWFIDNYAYNENKVIRFGINNLLLM